MIKMKDNISLSKETQKKLKSMASNDDESFEDIILRLIKSKIENSKKITVYKLKTEDFEIPLIIETNGEDNSKYMHFFDEIDKKWIDQLPIQSFQDTEVQECYERFTSNFKYLINNHEFFNSISSIEPGDKFIFEPGKFNIDNPFTIIREA